MTVKGCPAVLTRCHSLLRPWWTGSEGHLIVVVYLSKPEDVAPSKSQLSVDGWLKMVNDFNEDALIDFVLGRNF